MTAKRRELRSQGPESGFQSAKFGMFEAEISTWWLPQQLVCWKVTGYHASA